jgi:hypothetical protein
LTTIYGTASTERRYPAVTARGCRHFKHDSIFAEIEGQEGRMRKSTLFGIILLLLAASFASAGSFFKPTDSDEDFCFGYAICE